MKSSKRNKSMSISASTSISIQPTRYLLSRSRNSEFSHYLFEDGVSSADVKYSRQDQTNIHDLDEDQLLTIKEFDDIDYLAATLKSQDEFMCVNCYENIPIAKVDEHSITCCKPEANLGKIVDKIHKLIYNIREYKLGADDQYEYALIQLEDIAKNICEGTLTITQIFTQINAVINNNMNFQLILILAQRLEKIVEGFSEISERLKSPDKTIEDTLENIFNERTDHKSSFISMLSEINYDVIQSSSIIKMPESPEIQERYFYNQCVRKKLSLSHNHPAKNISVFHLYQECLQKSIPMIDWNDFISSSFESQIINLPLSN